MTNETSDNDLIRREDVKAKKVYCLERHEYVVPVAEIDWLPAVPQPMSAVEYLETVSRFLSWCDERSCDRCKHKNNCLLRGENETPEERVEIIKNWAKEHPERMTEDGK